MRMPGFLIALLFIFLSFTWLQAQVSQPYRFEKDQKFNDEDFVVIGMEDKGLALVRETRRYKAGNKTWELLLLDSILNERQNLEVEIDQRKSLIGHEYDSSAIYLLFKSGESLKTILDLVEVNVQTAEIKRIEIKPELAITLTHFSKVDNNFVFGGYVNTEPAVILFSSESQSMKILPGFFQKETELVELHGNRNNTFSVILIDRSQRDNRKLIFKVFDPQGKELLEDVIAIEGKKSLQTAIVSSLVRDDLILLGTWGGMNTKQSAGFFGVPVDPFSDQPITYTAFGEMKNYLGYLKENKRKRISQKTKSAVQAGRIPDYVNYIRPLKIVEYERGFLMLSEVFVPSSSSVQFRDYPYYGAPYPTPYTYYGPYYGNPSYNNRMYNPVYYGNDNLRSTAEVKISRSVVVSFNSSGEVQWDQFAELENMKMTSLEQITDFCLTPTYLYFLYKKGSDLRIKAIHLENNEVREFTEHIRLMTETDELRTEREQSGVLRHWYNNCFYVWGIQSIKSETSKGDGTKRVFYVNKVIVR
jgi:hypothetical protein